MVVRRIRTRAVADAPDVSQSRALLASRRRRGETDEPNPGRGRSARAASADSQVVASPNTDNPLGEIIDKARWQPQPARPGEYLHVSDVLHKCIRKRALEKRYSVIPQDKILSLSDMLTFDMGEAVHDRLKERARTGAADRVWGKWSCKCKYLTHDDPCLFTETDQDETCPHCGTHVDYYQEVSFFDDEYGMVGNPDLILYFARPDAFMVTELKSMSHKQWDELRRPDPDHVKQVVFYWHFMHRQGYRLCDRVSIMYVTKQWQFGAACVYKEFLIDPVAELHRLQPYIEDAKAYKASLADKKAPLPLRTMCAHRDAKTAKSCGQVEECFGD